MFSTEQIEKIGNSIRFFTKDKPLSKTKILKLIYLLEEISIRRYGIPFFNIGFNLWKFGPVVPDLYIDLSSQPALLKDFIDRVELDGHSLIKAKGVFCDDEFSENDLTVLDMVNSTFSSYDTSKLIEFTHKDNTPWYLTAKKHGVLEALLNEEIAHTCFLIDVSSVISYDETKKAIYESYVEIHGSPKMELECSCQVH